jgi:phage major head subunit gpT-like protein
MALDTAKAVAVLRDLTRTFDKSVKETVTFYPTICTIVPSSGEDEKYGWLGDIPSVREWLGERVFKELRAANYIVANKLWEDSLLVPKTKLADDRAGIYAPMYAMLGQRAASHPDKLVMTAVVNGATTTCFDSQYFFDTDHSWGDSGTQSNSLTYAAATGTTPTTDEFKLAFEQAVAAMLGFLDDQGEPMTQPLVGRLDNLVVLVPTALYATAVKATQALVVSNTTNVQVWNPTIVASPFLTDATKFYTFYVGGPLKPFVFQAREPLSRQTKGLEDIETKDAKFMTQARYNVGYLAWWNGVLTTFT